ncbi:MAG: FISUMP domain-containing protein [Bacteroidota bacterium]
MQTTTGTITIGGKAYPTITFKYQGIIYTFMTKNLDLDVGAGCKYYKDEPIHAQKLGRLYTWNAAKQAKPDGWDLIGVMAWEMLAELYTVPQLVEGGSSGMHFNYGGRYDVHTRKFIEMGDYGYYWTDQDRDGHTAELRFFESPALGGRLEDNQWNVDNVMLSARYFKRHDPNNDIIDPAIEPVLKRPGFQYGSFTDNRPDKGGKSHTYRTIHLRDGNEWMAENFNFEMSLDKTLDNVGSYDINPQRRKWYGLFYTWDAIHEVLPEGWRLPTVDEWTSLINAYGGEHQGYAALLNGGSSGLDLQLPGFRAGIEYNNSQVGTYGRYWTGSKDHAGNHGLVELKSEGQTAKIMYISMNSFYHTVRLIKKR